MASQSHTIRIVPRLIVYSLLLIAASFTFANIRQLAKPVTANAFTVPQGGGKLTVPYLLPQMPPYELVFKSEDTDDDAMPPPTVPDTRIPAVANGMAPVISRLDTKEPVVFLGIDDGAYKDPSVVALLKQNNIHATLFLADLFIHNNPQFFTGITANGSVTEDHTINHILGFSSLSYQKQKAEICGEADLQQQQFGRRPVLMRPPGGDWDTDTRRAAADCGMKAIVNWIAKANGGSMQYQIGDKLRPGDIVLMHFRPEFAQDLKAFVDAEQAAGLHTELLESWL